MLLHEHPGHFTGQAHIHTNAIVIRQYKPAGKYKRTELHKGEQWDPYTFCEGTSGDELH
jgi:hypothetical protein